MKSVHFILIMISLVLFSCKTDKKKEAPIAKEKLTIIGEIAHAHGYDNWKNVKEIQFTFNVDRDTSHFERHWVWKPKKNTVTSISEKDTLTYNRKKMDSTAYKTNSGFINDKYWLLAPFNIFWDEPNIKQEHTTQVEAPISKKPMQKLSVVYGNEGGYTPGDAYDFYFEDDYIIKEWVFRKGNQTEPSMITTWEDFEEFAGIKIAQMHKMDEGKFQLYFTNILVETY